MSKIKTRKSITKRFKITKNGKVMRRRNFRRHIKSTKSAKRLRRLKHSVMVKEPYAKRIRKRMGVAKKY